MKNEHEIVRNTLRDFSWYDYGLDSVEATLDDIVKPDWLYDLTDEIVSNLTVSGSVEGNKFNVE